MKKVLLLVALAAMTMTVKAQDLIIPTNALNPNLELTNCRLDPLTMNVGNTSTSSVICIGEVDFSENYQAVGMAFAQGYNGNGNYAILWGGQNFDSAKPFAQIALAHTVKYQNYVKLAGNMGYNVTDLANLPGGRLAYDGLSFTKPEGKQKVYITFVGGAGNVQAVHFYKNTFSPSDFHAAGGWEPQNGQLLRPIERSDYDQVHTRLDFKQSTIKENPTSQAAIDGDNGWGWTSEGVVVDYGEMDFGNGEFTQVCAFITHWSEGDEHINCGIDIYIDDYNNDANKLGFIFTGKDYDGRFHEEFWPKAIGIDRTITGRHRVYVKWHGKSTNVKYLDFCKGPQWCESPAPDYEILKLGVENETPSDRKKWYTMRKDVPAGATKIQNHAALNRAEPDGGGNYGWTGSKSVIKFGGIDFENGQYNRVILGYSTGNGDWIDYYKKYANISLYLDLDENAYDWTKAHEQLANVTPVAVVRHQATGGWGNVYNIGDTLARVTGVHDVYLVYYQAHSDQGANIFDLFLDRVKTPEITGIKINGEDLSLVDGQTNYNITITDYITAGNVEVSTLDTEDCTVNKVVNPTDIKDKYLVEITIQKGGNVLVRYTVNVTVVPKVNETPRNAKHYTMRYSVPEGATPINFDTHKEENDNPDILNQGKREDNGNVGYTGKNTVLRLHDIDFEDGKFNRIILGYSTGANNWKGNKEDANIKLYIDLEKNGQSYNWANACNELEQAGVEPIAVIRYQATGGWGNVLNIGDDLAKVTDVHDVYVVYNINDKGSDGANIFDYYLENVTEDNLATLENVAASDKHVVIGTDLEVVAVSDNYAWVRDNSESYAMVDNTEKKKSGNPANATYTQNNWLKLVFDGQVSGLNGMVLKNVRGVYSGSPYNSHEIVVSDYTVDGDAPTYEKNVYTVANFSNGIDLGSGVKQYMFNGAMTDIFFMTPKAEEVCTITYAYWDGNAFVMPQNDKTYNIKNEYGQGQTVSGLNPNGYEGSVEVDWSYSPSIESSKPNGSDMNLYEFTAIVERTAPAQAAPAHGASKVQAAGSIKVYPVDFRFDGATGNGGVVTSVEDLNVSRVNGSKAVKMIENGRVVIVKDGKKYNVMGQTIK